MQAQRANRQSGIELFKIIAIIIIVISHVSMSCAYTYDNWYPDMDYMLHLDAATTDIRQLIIAFTRYFGALGNDMFFIASAWFFLDSEHNNKRKWLLMLVDVWVISVVGLLISYPIISSYMPEDAILKSLLPTTFNNNWYMTCYLLFYLVYPLLNRLINVIDRTTLFRCVLVLLFLYVLCNFLRGDLFYPSNLILWITFYLLMAYMKRYWPERMNDARWNRILLWLGIIGNLALFLGTNWLGTHTSHFGYSLMRWDVYSNPFLLAIAIAGFNLVRQTSWKNQTVNSIAGLSLYIYLIHENIIVRYYYRPMIMDRLYHAYGHDAMLLCMLAFSAVLFVLSMICGCIYKATLHRLVQACIDPMYRLIQKGYLRLERMLL